MSDIIKYDQMSYYYYGQAKETEFDGEGQLTSAVSYVTNDVQKNIYVTEGHGEAALGTLTSDMLEKSGLTVNTINLLTGGGIDQLQRFRGSHSIVIKPSGHDEGGNDMAAAALSPVGFSPEIVVVGMLQPFV